METELNVRIANLEQGHPENVSVKEQFSFESNETASGEEFIYINPLIFPHIKENPFKAETRKLPVEYSYPYDHVTTVNLLIPDGYELDEAPSPEIFTLGNQQITYSYQIKKIENNIQLNQRITVRQTLYPTMEYQNIRYFWAHIVNKNNAQLVLKRK
jgi:hypothetical protein